MSSILDFLAAANKAINGTAKEQAARNALAAAYLNIAPTHSAAAINAAPGKPALQADKQLSPLAATAAQAAKSIAKEIDRQQRLSEGAGKYLGIADKSNPAVRRLAASMDLLEKKEVKGAKALRKAFDSVQKSALLAAAANAVFDLQLKRMTQNASPGLVRAWGGAFDILMADLGSQLIPVVMSAADTIFDVIDAFEGMDDSTKKLIAYGALAVPAVALLGHSCMALAPAARLAAVGVRGLLAYLGPIGATVAAIGLIASGVAAAKYYGSRGEEDLKESERAGTRVSISQLEEAFEEMTMGNRRSIVGGFLPSAKDAADKAMSMTAAEKQEKAKEARGIAANLREWAQPEAAATFERVASVMERASNQGTISAQEEREDKRKESLTRQARHYNTMIAEARREQRPAYSGLAEARKGVQLATLGKGPIEQKLLDIQRKNIPKMAARLEKIMKEIEELNRNNRRSG